MPDEPDDQTQESRRHPLGGSGSDGTQNEYRPSGTRRYDER